MVQATPAADVKPESASQLKADFAKRLHQRPISHSVAVAYRLVIARQEKSQNNCR